MFHRLRCSSLIAKLDYEFSEQARDISLKMYMTLLPPFIINPVIICMLWVNYPTVRYELAGDSPYFTVQHTRLNIRFP